MASVVELHHLDYMSCHRILIDSKSPNAMDTNWGGVEHSRKSVEQGKYVKYTRKVPDKKYDFMAHKERHRHAKEYRTKPE